jgi:hypothetical protein
MIKSIVMFLVLFAVNTANAADIVTGNSLSEYCNSKSYFSQGMCIGFISGAANVYTYADSLCVPKNVTYGQIANIVEKYLNENPKSTHLPGELLVAMALEDTFSCPKNKKGQ